MRRFASVLVLGMLLGPLAACPKAAIQTQDRAQQSRALLREGIAAMDKGNMAEAEDKLTRAVEIDPLHERARVVLASFHAGQAGFVMSSLADPLFKAASELEGQSKGLLAQARDLQVEALTGRIEKPLSAVDAQAAKRADEAKEKLKAFTKDASEFVSNMQLLLVVLNTFPYLPKDRLARLDKAIHILRAGGLVPSARSEEVRVYLAVLGAVRFVHGLKSVMGDAALDAGNLDKLKATLCALTRGAIKDQMLEIRTSLNFVEEGLVVVPTDPDTSKRKSRKRIQEFVSKILSSGVLGSIERITDPQTEDGKAADELSRLYCQ